MTSPSRKRCVTSFCGCSLPDCDQLQQHRRRHGVDEPRGERDVVGPEPLEVRARTGLPWTPMLAMRPPGATIDWQMSKVAGMPTASIATSTPAPPVSSITSSTGLAVGAVDELRGAERPRHLEPVVVEVDHHDLGRRVELRRQQRGEADRARARRWRRCRRASPARSARRTRSRSGGCRSASRAPPRRRPAGAR